MAKSKEKNALAPEFLRELLDARSPSGSEYESQAVLEKYIKTIADRYDKDAIGNRIATLNLKGDPIVMLAGHMDELGFMIRYIDKNGFLYFDTLGGHDSTIIPGRRVCIFTKNGIVKGVTGKRAIHLIKTEERGKSLEIEKIWIDIGAKDKKDAERLVSIGDSIVYEQSFEVLQGSRATARAFDNKAGCYVVMETLRRLARQKGKMKAKLVSVATSQEEVGVRGATISTYSVNPHIGIAVDVGHATDHPEIEQKQFGEFYLGKGPIIARGPNINPIVFEKLISCANKQRIPYQIQADARPMGTDARIMQMTRQGVATAIVSIPLRYMHTPSEVVDLHDLENAVKLLVAFVLSLKNNEYCIW